MILCRNLDTKDIIRNENEWFTKCPPQKGKEHWVDGRSAKETAKAWIKGVPKEFLETVKPLKLSIDIISPEHISSFDNYAGNARNHDLLILDTSNKIVVGVESKVDEPFGDTTEKRLHDGIIEHNKNPNSNAQKRVEGLLRAIFGSSNNEILQLRYQLLHAIAGTIAEAKKQGYHKAVFIVQTFLTNKIDIEKHRTNQRDLDLFILKLSKGKYKNIQDGELIGPLRVPGNDDKIPNYIDLFIGKYSIKI